MWRLRPTVVAGAMWAVFALAVARWRLRRTGVSARVPLPDKLPMSSARGVNGVLHRTAPTCLERALVAQAWRATHGDPRDIVIGVPATGLHSGAAHAWLDGVDLASESSHMELHRIHPPRGSD